MLAQINAWGLLSAGYVYRGLYLFGVGREGARQHCLGGLIQDLSKWGVTQLTIESRRPRENMFDATTIHKTRPVTLAFSDDSLLRSRVWQEGISTTSTQTCSKRSQTLGERWSSSIRPRK